METLYFGGRALIAREIGVQQFFRLAFQLLEIRTLGESPGGK